MNKLVCSVFNLFFVAIGVLGALDIADKHTVTDSVFVQDLVGDSLNIVHSDRSAYIFVGGYTCKECIPKLEQAILNADSLYKVHVVLRTTPGMRVFEKKVEIKRVSSLIESRSFYFDIGASSGLGKYQGGVFDQFDISMSPAVLLNFPDKEAIFINYQYLFGLPSDKTDLETDLCSRTIANALHRD